MSDLIREYERRRPGGHWFDPDTMRFFRSRLSGAEHWRKDGNVIFTTSEKPPRCARAYSVRVMDRDGDISTVGPFCTWSRAVAIRVARDLARSGKATVDGETYTLDGEG